MKASARFTLKSHTIASLEVLATQYDQRRSWLKQETKRKHRVNCRQRIRDNNGNFYKRAIFRLRFVSLACLDQSHRSVHDTNPLFVNLTQHIVQRYTILVYIWSHERRFRSLASSAELRRNGSIQVAGHRLPKFPRVFS